MGCAHVVYCVLCVACRVSCALVLVHLSSSFVLCGCPSYENVWPAMAKDAHGAIVVFDINKVGQENDLMPWYVHIQVDRPLPPTTTQTNKQTNKQNTQQCNTTKEQRNKQTNKARNNTTPTKQRDTVWLNQVQDLCEASWAAEWPVRRLCQQPVDRATHKNRCDHR